MKKIFLSVILSLATTQAFANGDGPGNSTISATLKCRTGACHDVEAPSNGGSWCFKKAGVEAAGVYSASSMTLSFDGKSIFKTNSDGDQYTTVSFEIEKLKNVKVGAAVKGTYSDNFWWADGDHTRYTVDLDCTKLK